MDRRKALQTAGWIAGTGLIAPGVLAVLQSCRDKARNSDWTPRVLSEDQALRLTKISDTILPSTDTPSASDVYVPEFIDLIMVDVLTEDQNQSITRCLDECNQISIDHTGEEFSNATQEDRIKLVKSIDAAAFNSGNSSGYDPAFLDSYKYLKSLILSAYFTTEEGVKKNLNYVVIPGKYEGCIDLPADKKVMVGNHM